MADPVSSLKPLQRALLHADQPLTVLWFLRVGCLVTIVMVSDKLQVARRAPALHRFAGRTARSFHFAAIATAAATAGRPRKQASNRQHYSPSRASPVNHSRNESHRSHKSNGPACPPRTTRQKPG